MMASLHGVDLALPNQRELDWLLGNGVSTEALVRPVAVLVATGGVDHEGRFEATPTGDRWLAFEQAADIAVWQPRQRRHLAVEGRSFAIGEDIIDNPGTYTFDCNLNIFSDPLDWLRADRDGIVVLDWSLAFDRLRDVPRIAICESLLATYRQHMRPARYPELFVITANRRAA